MIGRILKSGSFGSKVDYVTREKHDKRIYTPDTWKVLGSRGLIGEKRLRIIASFEAQAMLNPKRKNPAGHITLSFSAEDRRKLSDEKMLKIARDYIRMMGLGKTQWLVVRHYETDKPHCHIVFNQIGDDGKWTDAGRNQYKNKRVCEALTERYRLALPKRDAPDLDKLHGVERAKAEIRIAATEALKKSRNWQEFARELSKKGVMLVPKYRRGTTEMQGVSFRLGDYKVKGSDVGEAFKYRNLERYFSQSAQRSAPRKATSTYGNATASAGHSVLEDVLKATKSTAATALDAAAEISTGLAGLASGLFQPGSGMPDENELRDAYELTHKKRKKPGIRR